MAPKHEGWIVGSRPFLEKGVGSEDGATKVWLVESDADAEVTRLGSPYRKFRVLVEVEPMTEEEEEALHGKAPEASTYRGWAEAFTIFAKYGPDDEHVQGEHDEIYAGPSPKKVEPDDRKRLIELGWRDDERHDCWHKFT